MSTTTVAPAERHTYADGGAVARIREGGSIPIVQDFKDILGAVVPPNPCAR
mgnify:CR=1 FL=1